MFDLQNFRKDNSAVSLSMNTIIIAAISLIVLVMLIYLVVNHLGSTEKATSCNREGGVCINCNQCDENTMYTQLVDDGTCPGSEDKCCKLPVGG